MTPLTRRRAFGPLVGLVAFVVTLLLVGSVAILADLGLRQAEMTQLVSRIEASEERMILVQEEIERITTAYESLEAPDDADRAELVGELADAAAYGQEAIAQAGAAMAGDTYLPWHTAIIRAHNDYLLHNQSWTDYLGRSAVDPGELTVPQEDIDSTFMDAEASVRAALPPLASTDLRNRIDVIFAEPENSGGQAA